MQKSTPAGIALRLYLCVRTFTVALVSLAVPASLNGRLIADSGWPAYAATAAMIVCAIAGVLDVLINDLLPDRFGIPYLQEHRHMGYIGLAIGGCVFLFAMAKSDNITWLAMSYFVDASFATFVAVRHVLRNQASRNYPALERRKGRA